VRYRDPSLELASAGEPDPAQPAPAATGAWLSSALFALVLAAGLWLAAFALARPFVPAAWLR